MLFSIPTSRYINNYVPDQHTKNINKRLYMQPQIHTACTTDYNVDQFLLYL